MPLNKQLYTFSYVCLTSGAAALTISTFYILVIMSSTSEINWTLWWLFFLQYEVPLAALTFSVKQWLVGIPLGTNYSLIIFSNKCVIFPFTICIWLDFDYLLCQVDILKLKYVFLPFEWIGMNAMLVYVMAAEGIFAGFINGWYYKSPHNTLVYFSVKNNNFLPLD